MSSSKDKKSHKKSHKSKSRHGEEVETVSVAPSAITTKTSDGKRLKELISAKERELKDLADAHQRALDEALVAKEEEVKGHQVRFSKMEKDFLYNLKLLEERDAELSRFEKLFKSTKGILRDREKQISEQNVIIDELKASLASTKQELLELESRSRAQINALQNQLLEMKEAHERAMEEARKKFERQAKELQAKIQSSVEALEVQRREMTRSFEEAQHVREQTYNKMEASLQSAVDTAQSNERQALRERDSAEESKIFLKEQCDSAKKRVRELEKEVKELQWKAKEAERDRAADTQRLELRGIGEVERLQNELADERQEKSELRGIISSLEDRIVRQHREHEEFVVDIRNKHEQQMKVRLREARLREDSLLEKINSLHDENRRAAANTSSSAFTEMDAQLSHIREEMKRQEERLVKEGEAALHSKELQVSELRALLEDRSAAQEGLQKQVVDLRAMLERERTLREVQASTQIYPVPFDGVKDESPQRVESVRNNDKDSGSMDMDAMGSPYREEKKNVVESDPKLRLQTSGSLSVNEIGEADKVASAQGYSPVFSGDMGPVSPLASIPPSLPFSPTSHVASTRRNQQKHFFPPSVASTPAGGIGEHPSSDLGLARALREKEELKQRNAELTQQNDAVRNIIGEMRVEMEKLHNEQVANQKNREAAVVERTKHLRARVKELEVQISSLVQEREKLMDLSNMLRADLSRVCKDWVYLLCIYVNFFYFSLFSSSSSSSFFRLYS